MDYSRGGALFDKVFGKASVANQMHNSDLAVCGKKYSIFWFHFEVKFLTSSFWLDHFSTFSCNVSINIYIYNSI